MTTPSPLLATLDELAKKATPPPWRSAVSLTSRGEMQTGASVLTFGNPGPRIAHLSNMFFEQEQCGANADFIAALVTAYPRLRASSAAAEELRDAVVSIALNGWRVTVRDVKRLDAALAAYDAARAGDGEKTT